MVSEIFYALFAGSGATTVEGSPQGHGADSIIGGSGSLVVEGNGGNMLVVGGGGTANVSVGGGASLVFAGPGTMRLVEGAGTGQVLLGSGQTTVTEGSGGMTYDLVKGDAGGAAAITGFRPGMDQLDMFGYGPAAMQVSSSGGNTVLSMNDVPGNQELVIRQTLQRSCACGPVIACLGHIPLPCVRFLWTGRLCLPVV